MAKKGRTYNIKKIKKSTGLSSYNFIIWGINMFIHALLEKK